MIYEIRTYDCIPGGAEELIDGIGEKYEHRARYSEVAGFWRTDIGPLHQVVHLWPYESLDDRLRVRGEAAKDENWPPDVSHLVVDMQSEICLPAPFCPETPRGDLGPVYEMRAYTLKPGSFPEVARRWESALEERLKLSPLAFAGVTEHGGLNKFIHIWPYESLDHRAEVRARAQATGVWPPRRGRQLSLRQERKLLLHAPFSPLR